MEMCRKYIAIGFCLAPVIGPLYLEYLTIILRARVGYEMIDSQGGA